MAGLVAIKTLSPLEKQGSKVKLSFGNYNLWGVNASTSQKITDNLAVGPQRPLPPQRRRLRVKNQYTHRNSGSTRSGGGRIQIDLAGQPTVETEPHRRLREQRPAGIPLRLLRQGSAQDRRHRLQRRGLVPPRSPHLGVIGTIHPRPVHLHLDHRLPVPLDDDMHLDQDFTPLSIFTLQQKQQMHAVSQEFAIKSHQGKRWEWVGGLFGFYQDIHTQGPSTSSKTASTCSSTQQTQQPAGGPQAEPRPGPACPTSP